MQTPCHLRNRCLLKTRYLFRFTRCVADPPSGNHVARSHLGRVSHCFFPGQHWNGVSQRGYPQTAGSRSLDHRSVFLPFRARFGGMDDPVMSNTSVDSPSLNEFGHCSAGFRAESTLKNGYGVPEHCTFTGFSARTFGTSHGLP